MNELNVLNLFYEEMTAQSKNRNQIFLNMDEVAAGILSQQNKKEITVDELHRLTDICIANEWLERTTIDPGYNFLSLTEAGLQVVLEHFYKG